MLERNQNLQEGGNDDEMDEGQDDDEMEDVELTSPLSIEEEDYCRITLDNAINDKMHSPNTEWPNDIFSQIYGNCH